MNPQELRYTATHEWISADGTVGITEHAQEEITDVVFVELPVGGRLVAARESVAVVESVKAAFDIYPPVSGTIASVNGALAEHPELVNESPLGRGWLFKIQDFDEAERDHLMTPEQYQDYLEEERER